MGRILLSKNSTTSQMCKKLEIFILIIGMLIFAQSCNNDIELFDSVDPIPLVYAVICPDDSIHEIRLNKSFGADYNWARDVRINDSLYFDDVEIYLDFRSDSGHILERVKFQEVIIDDKTEGLFSEAPNKIYQARGFQLRYPFGEEPWQTSGDMTYYLTINIPYYDRAVFSQVNMPRMAQVNCNIRDNEKVNFYDFYVRPKTINIKLDDEFATELEIQIYFEEYLDDEWISNSIQYHSKYGICDNPNGCFHTIDFSPEWFYTLMKKPYHNMEY